MGKIPTQPQGRANVVALLKEFRTQLDARGQSAPGQFGRFVDAVNPNNASSGNPPNYAGAAAIQLDPALAGVVATERNSFVDLNVLPFSHLFHEPRSKHPMPLTA